jgi:polyhydroxyalkanoate synthesis regulator phasin
MESFTIRKKSGKLEGPYGVRVIRAFVVSGRLTPDDILVTGDGDLPIAQHPAFSDLWRSPSDTTNKRPRSSAKNPSKSPTKSPAKGRIVLLQGRVLPPGPNPDFAGSLVKNPLVYLVYRFALSKLTGRLHLRCNRETVDLFLEHGVPTYAMSNRIETRLGELLLTDKLLDTQQHDAVLDRVFSERRPLGQIVLEEKLLSAAQIKEALFKQFMIRFNMALGWKDNAVYRFYQNQVTGGSFPIEINVWHLLKEGTSQAMSIERIEDELLPYRNALLIRQIHPKLKPEQFGLHPQEQTFVEGITQRDPLNDVIGDAVERQLLTEEQAHRLVYLLWRTEQIRTGEEKMGARTKRQIKELADFIKQLKLQSRLQRLGLQGGASQTEIRRSYLSLAKRYHPDHLPPGTHTEVAKHMSEAFALIAEAYRVLSA